MRTPTKSGKRPRAVLITTVPQTLGFFTQQIRDLKDAGFHVEAISSPGPALEAYREEVDIPLHAVEMNRSISPLADCRAIFRLARKLRQIRPEIVQTHTPKAGLLGMMAALAVGVPIRIYTVNGLVWETRQGWRGQLLRMAERVAAMASTRVLCVSASVRLAMLSRAICPAGKAAVLGYGGSHGVDLAKFDPTRYSAESRRQTRIRLGLRENSLVIGFVGRFVIDKGIDTLVAAWRTVRESLPEAQLFLAGARENCHPIPDALWSEITNDPGIVLTTGFVGEMPEVYSALDILVLPTLREGLPNVLLEAGAMEVPVVATNATGCVDVVRDNESGILVDIGDGPQLAAALLRMGSNVELRSRIAQKARENVLANFSENEVSARLIEEYRRLLLAGSAA